MGPQNRCPVETAPRALPQASRQPRARSGGAQDSCKSDLGDFKTAPRALREASRRLQERSGRPQDASRALRDASRRLQERSGRLETAQERSGRPQDDSHRRSSFSKWGFPQEHLRVLSRLLKKSQHQAYLDLGLNVTQSGRSETHSKNLFDSAQLDSASFGSTSSVHGYARVHTCLKERSKRPEDSSKSAQEASRCPQERFKMHQK